MFTGGSTRKAFCPGAGARCERLRHPSGSSPCRWAEPRATLGDGTPAVHEDRRVWPVERPYSMAVRIELYEPKANELALRCVPARIGTMLYVPLNYNLQETERTEAERCRTTPTQLKFSQTS